ncbi:hypothetical protein [Maritalea sp.]|uniref:hypothetical protein n=1 Tax=Maritalea sp. TaxID=2003361 RepID=UPI003EF935B4
MIQLIDQFKHKERSQSDWLRQQKWFVKARQEAKQRVDSERKLDDDILAAAIETTTATSDQIKLFNTKLDTYHEASTAALIENQALLDDIAKRMLAVENRLAPHWEHANIMDDGRRVFLNAERSQAYDEWGSEVSDDEYAYDNFAADHRPVDSFLDALKERGSLKAEQENVLDARHRIHEFEELTDAAREEASKEGVTQERLDELSADLEDFMPEEVAQHMPDYKPPADALNLTSEFAKPASPLVEPFVNTAINASEFTQ